MGSEGPELGGEIPSWDVAASAGHENGWPETVLRAGHGAAEDGEEKTVDDGASNVGEGDVRSSSCPAPLSPPSSLGRIRTNRAEGEMGRSVSHDSMAVAMVAEEWARAATGVQGARSTPPLAGKDEGRGEDRGRGMLSEGQGKWKGSSPRQRKPLPAEKRSSGEAPKLTRSATAEADMMVHATRASFRDAGRTLSAWDYCCAELGLRVGAREDDPDMAVARERVFDIIWYIPLEFERLNFYGGLLCADAILGVVTSLPVRVICQTTRLFFSPAVGVISLVGLREWGGRGQAGGSEGGRRQTRDSGSKRKNWGFHPYAREHLSDSLWLLMLVAAVAANQLVDVSMVYHYIRGQEVIKLYLAVSVLECFDKLCSAFNCHVLDALQNSVYIVVNTAATSGSTSELVHASFQLSFDAALTMLATVAHTMIMLLHAVTLSVAINSHTNAMLLVLISNNFGEIKGHVFKRMDPDKLFSVARMDIVERVHLSICLMFVAAQRVTAAGSLAAGLTRKMLVDTAMVVGSEVGVDIFKHAFMCKFNALRPKVYRGYLRQLCREHVKLAQSYKLHRVVGFVPLAPAAVLIKVLPDLYRTLMPATAPGDSTYGLGGDREAWVDGFRGSGGEGEWGFAGSDGAGNLAATGITAGEGSWAAWTDAAALWLVSWFRRIVPNPGEAAGFLLAFIALVVFKLAFGIALHCFGVFMLENFPAEKYASGSRRKAGTGTASSNASDFDASTRKSSGGEDLTSDATSARAAGITDDGGLSKGASTQRLMPTAGGTLKASPLPPIPGSPKTPPRHKLFAPI